MDKLIIGSQEYGGDFFYPPECHMEISVVGDELSVDTLEADVLSSQAEQTVFRPVGSRGLKTSNGKIVCVVANQPGNLLTVPFGSAIDQYRGAERLWRFYLNEITRVGKHRYTIRGISAVGLLSESYHTGGIYTGQTAETIITEVCGGIVKPDIEAAIKPVQLYGWLPYATRRENLNQVLFALGANVVKTDGVGIAVRYLSSDVKSALSGDDVFLGGSVDYEKPASLVEVTEHQYIALATDEVQTLFDNTEDAETAGNQLVTFSAPVHDLAASGGLTIQESGANYAVLSGTGTLTGKAYTHRTKIVAVENTAATWENVVTVEDASLVSFANSHAVAQRVLDYYANGKTVNVDIVLEDQRPGDVVTLTDPYGDNVTGLIRSLDVSFGRFMRATAQIVAGYIPKPGGNDYDAYELLTSGESYQVPQGVSHLHVVLIGGGTGGGSGHPGENVGKQESMETSVPPGDTITYVPLAEAGEGGEGGTPGEGGKILEIDLAVTPGAIFPVSFGAGGAGGAGTHQDPVSGSAGTATAFGAYTSDSGRQIAGGYANPLTGDIYAGSGSAGVKGGRGSGRDPDAEEGDQTVTVLPGETVTDGETVWTPGGSGTAEDEKEGHLGGIEVRSYMRVLTCGGGPAYGANGGDGLSVSTTQIDTSGSTPKATTMSAHGGDGATPTARAAQTKIGYGGDAGHGGGGAGSNGLPMARSYGGTAIRTAGIKPASEYNGIYPDAITDELAAVGGKGGDGGQGGPGGILIFYKQP